MPGRAPPWLRRQLSPAFRACALSARPCGGCRHLLDDRHVSPVLDGLVNTLSVTEALLTAMEEPAAHGHNAGRGIRGPRTVKLGHNCARILHARRLPFDDLGPQPTPRAPEGD